MAEALIALGSNLGDRRGFLQFAARRLRELPQSVITGGSALYATAAVGIPGAPDFLNAVLKLETAVDPESLLEACLRIEAEAGRSRGGEPGWSSRTLDLDLLRHGDSVSASARLTLPHPRIAERLFVLAPLREVAPAWVIAGRTVADWADAAGANALQPVPGSRNWFRVEPADGRASG